MKPPKKEFSLKSQQVVFLATLVLLLTTTALASPLCPGGLSPLPSATWGGSGIPNDAVCQQSAGGVTVGMIAHGRFGNPAVGNDGLGTFFATAGGDITSVPSAACPLGLCAKWNFGFFVQNSTNNAVSVTVDWGNGGFVTQVLAAGQTWQDSWNLGFGFVDTGVPIPGTYNPSSVLFDPSASGIYPFTLSVNGVTGGPIAAVGIDVVVGDSSVPEPTTFGMLAFALGGLTLLPGRWRRRKHR